MRSSGAAAGVTVGPPTRISDAAESSTRVQNSGRPSVVTCEHASVSP